jgi:hypothetical protein
MPIQVEAPELEACWKAWEEKNRLRDQRINDRIRSLFWGVAALIAVIVFCLLF